MFCPDNVIYGPTDPEVTLVSWLLNVHSFWVLRSLFYPF